MQDTTRNATLEDLAVLLMEQDARKVDMIVPARSLVARDGMLAVDGADPIITADGVTAADGTYSLTTPAEEHVAARFGIPRDYLRKMREGERLDLWDANVNGWLHGPSGEEHDRRNFMLRTFKPDTPGGVGIGRALLSDRFARLDNLDTLTAVLEGIKAAGVHADITSADLTERRMIVRVNAPEVTTYAPDLLRGYRSPFTGQSGDDLPVVSAGLVFSNSEVGNGAWTITPRMTVQVCTNGMTVSKDALRAKHLGGRMEEGVIEWSASTQQKQLELITAKTVDAIATYLDVDYMRKALARITEQAAEEVETVEQVETLAKAALFTQDQTAAILGHFIRGGQMTRGGVMQAATAAAQECADGDDAYEMEAKAERLLTV